MLQRLTLVVVAIVAALAFSSSAPARINPTSGSGGLTTATADASYLRRDGTNAMNATLPTTVGSFSSSVATGSTAFDFQTIPSHTTGRTFQIGGTAAGQDQLTYDTNTLGGSLNLREAGAVNTSLGGGGLQFSGNTVNGHTVYSTNTTGPYGLKMGSNVDAAGETAVFIGGQNASTTPDIIAFGQVPIGASTVRARITGLGGVVVGSSKSTTPALPACAVGIEFAIMGYDDTDDANAGTVCACVANAAGVYGWVSQTGSVCP